VKQQREFDALRGAKAVRFSGGQFCFSIESLDNAGRAHAQIAKPIENEGPMTPQGA